jgi:hypothetical protein
MSAYFYAVDTLDDVTDAPTLAPTPAVSDAMIDRMNADLLDVVRNNAELSEAELVLLAQQADRQTAAILAASIAREAAKATPADVDETAVHVNGYKFKARAKLAGGRWHDAGQYRKEPDAWRAAASLLDTLRRRDRQTACPPRPASSSTTAPASSPWTAAGPSPTSCAPASPSAASSRSRVSRWTCDRRRQPQPFGAFPMPKLTPKPESFACGDCVVRAAYRKPGGPSIGWLVFRGHRLVVYLPTDDRFGFTPPAARRAAERYARGTQTPRDFMRAIYYDATDPRPAWLAFCGRWPVLAMRSKSEGSDRMYFHRSTGLLSFSCHDRHPRRRPAPPRPIRFERVNVPTAAGHVIEMKLPRDRTPILARPGMPVMLGGQGGSDYGVIVAARARRCDVVGERGNRLSLKWGEVLLVGTARPDPAYVA